VAPYPDPWGTAITFQRALNRIAERALVKTIAANHASPGRKIIRPIEQKAVVAAPSQLRTITAPALPRSNQIDATLFDLMLPRITGIQL
jgi:hypothetical protein